MRDRESLLVDSQIEIFELAADCWIGYMGFARTHANNRRGGMNGNKHSLVRVWSLFVVDSDGLVVLMRRVLHVELCDLVFFFFFLVFKIFFFFSFFFKKKKGGVGGGGGGGRSPEFLMRAVTAVGSWGIIFAMYFTTEEVWRRYSKPVSRRSGRWLVRPMLWTCDSLSFSKTDRGEGRSAHHFFAPPPFFLIWSLSLCSRVYVDLQPISPFRGFLPSLNLLHLSLSSAF